MDTGYAFIGRVYEVYRDLAKEEAMLGRLMSSKQPLDLAESFIERTLRLRKLVALIEKEIPLKRLRELIFEVDPELVKVTCGLARISVDDWKQLKDIQKG